MSKLTFEYLYLFEYWKIERFIRIIVTNSVKFRAWLPDFSSRATNKSYYQPAHTTSRQCVPVPHIVVHLGIPAVEPQHPATFTTILPCKTMKTCSLKDTIITSHGLGQVFMLDSTFIEYLLKSNMEVGTSANAVLISLSALKYGFCWKMAVLHALTRTFTNKCRISINLVCNFYSVLSKRRLWYIFLMKHVLCWLTVLMLSLILIECVGLQKWAWHLQSADWWAVDKATVLWIIVWFFISSCW